MNSKLWAQLRLFEYHKLMNATDVFVLFDLVLKIWVDLPEEEKKDGYNHTNTIKKACELCQETTDKTSELLKKAQDLDKAQKIINDEPERVAEAIVKNVLWWNPDENPSPEHCELTTEELEIVNQEEKLNPIIYDQPILKSLEKRNDVARYGNGLEYSNEIDEPLTRYELAVFETGLTALKQLGKTKNGNIVMTERQGLELLTGNSRDFIETQRKEYINAWENIAKKTHTFKGSVKLFSELGMQGYVDEIDEITDMLSDDKEEILNGNITSIESIIKLRIIDYVKKGKPVKVLLIIPNEIIKNLVTRYNFSEPIPQNALKVMTYKGNECKSWYLTKDRIALRSYIYSWIYKRKRALGAGKESTVGNKIPYCEILDGANVELDKNKRRIADIKTIFTHLAKLGIIVDFTEYDTRYEKARGIKVMFPMERLTQ